MPTLKGKVLNEIKYEKKGVQCQDLGDESVKDLAFCIITMFEGSRSVYPSLRSSVISLELPLLALENFDSHSISCT